MRGVVVAVAMLAAMASAEAKTWTCQALGQRYCKDGECSISAPRVKWDIDSAIIDRVQSAGDDETYMQISKDRALVMQWSDAKSQEAGIVVQYGHCWPKVTPRL